MPDEVPADTAVLFDCILSLNKFVEDRMERDEDLQWQSWP